MRLLLITLTCLTASLALPQPKQKRDILPGDPRYGTEHHHHHHHPEAVVEEVRTVHGFSYTSSEAPRNAYGPPGYEPGAPLGNQYLAPAIEANRHSTPVSSYGAPDTTVNAVETANGSEIGQTIEVPVSVEKFKASVPPSTSYGVPINTGAKATVATGINSHVKSTLKTVQTDFHEHQNVGTTVGKVEHAPVVQEVTRYQKTAVPAVATTVTKNVLGNTVYAGAYPNTYTGYDGFYDVPSYDVPSYFPTTFYSGFNSFDSVPTGYSYQLPSVDHGVHLNVPTSYATFPQTVRIPQTTVQVPHTVTKVVQRVQQPVHTYTSTPVQHTYTSTPVQHTYTSTPVQHTYTSTPVQHTYTSTPVQHTYTSTPVQHSVHSVQPVSQVRYTETVAPVKHTLHTVQAAPEVKTVTPIQQTVHSVHPVQSVKYTETAQPIESVDTVEAVTAHPVDTVDTVSTVHPVKSVEILQTSAQPVEILQTSAQPVETHHTVTEVVKSKTVPVAHDHVQIQTERGPISDFFGNLGDNLSLPSFPSFPSLPSFPSFPSLPSLPGGPSSVAPPVESSPSGVSLNNTPSQDTVIVENPLITSSKSHFASANEYVQPTDENGGYIY